jgi:hypothetical protein
MNLFKAATGTALLVSGGLYFLAGILKLADLPGFYQSILSYNLTGPALSRPVAYFLPWFEIVVAIAFFTPTFRRSAGGLLLLSTFTFMGLTLYAWGIGLPPNCGCFGGLSAWMQSHLQHLLVNTILAGLIFLGMRCPAKS